MKEALSRQEVRRQETRALIQSAARRLIVEHGYEKTTMRMLAKEAGVGLGTIGLHFKDKQSLLLASFYDEIGALSLKAIDEVREHDSIEGQFLSIASTLYQYYGTNTGYLRSVVREALFTRGEWRERFDEQVVQTVEVAAGLFEQAKARGEVRNDVDSFQAGYACWSLYLTILIDGLNSEEFDAEAQVAKLKPMVALLMKGLAVK